MNLPDYNPEARCPKCGFDSVTTKYVGRVQIPNQYDIAYAKQVYPDNRALTGEDPPPLVIPEHLLRTCVRCNYQWNEEIIGVKEIDVRSSVDE